MEPLKVTGIAQVLGISNARVQQLAADGVLPRAGVGLYDIPACVQAFVRYKLEKAGAADLATKGLVTERSRLARLKADRAEREARVESGELVPAGDIEAAWLATAGMVRTRVLAVPKKIAPRIIVLKTATEAEALMQKEIHAALAALAAIPSIKH